MILIELHQLSESLIPLIVVLLLLFLSICCFIHLWKIEVTTIKFRRDTLVLDPMTSSLGVTRICLLEDHTYFHIRLEIIDLSHHDFTHYFLSG